MISCQAITHYHSLYYKFSNGPKPSGIGTTTTSKVEVYGVYTAVDVALVQSRPWYTIIQSSMCS